MYYDLLCSACADHHPKFKEFLDMPFLGKTVKEVVKVNYVFMPLPYHHGAYAVTKLTAFMIDECIVDPASCKLLEYMDFCFDYQDEVLDAVDWSYYTYMRNWTKFTADSLAINYENLIDAQYGGTDKHNSDTRTITMWKYCTSRGVNGTPTAAVNGIILESMPEEAQDWLDMLT